MPARGCPLTGPVVWRTPTHLRPCGAPSQRAMMPLGLLAARRSGKGLAGLLLAYHQGSDWCLPIAAAGIIINGSNTGPTTCYGSRAAQDSLVASASVPCTRISGNAHSDSCSPAGAHASTSSSAAACSMHDSWRWGQRQQLRGHAKAAQSAASPHPKPPRRQLMHATIDIATIINRQKGPQGFQVRGTGIYLHQTSCTP